MIMMAHAKHEGTFEEQGPVTKVNPRLETWQKWRDLIQGNLEV
jgi:hypothetical protein